MIFNLIGQTLCGWLIADFLSGLIHWLCDRVIPLRTPILGPTIVLANREHHDDPAGFLQASLLMRNRGLLVAAVVIAALWWAILGPSPMLAAAAVGGLLSGEIHVLAHRTAPPPLWLRWAWSTGLVQPPAVHARHHRAPHTTGYCVVTTWLNPLLDALGFWRGLERVLNTKT